LTSSTAAPSIVSADGGSGGGLLGFTLESLLSPPSAAPHITHLNAGMSASDGLLISGGGGGGSGSSMLPPPSAAPTKDTTAAVTASATVTSDTTGAANAAALAETLK